MKKIKLLENIRAFSLAEALITLLIVCLITLASVPVITKKKRDPKNSTATGTWMCTKNKDGNYVVYSSNNATSTMDKNNPKTWTVLEGATSCTFTPPMNAKNFTMTLIGGGGGGRDGSTEHVEYMSGDSNERYFVTKETEGEFKFAIAGGGGGAGISNNVVGAGYYGKTYVGGAGGGGQAGAGAVRDVHAA